MSSLAPEYLDRLALAPTEAATLRQLGEHRGREALYARQRPEVLEALRMEAFAVSLDERMGLDGDGAVSKSEYLAAVRKYHVAHGARPS